MVKNYELYCIFDGELAAEKRAKEIAKVEKQLKEDLSAETVKVNEEGAKKFAYPIKKQKMGYYVLYTFDVPYEKTAQVNGFEKKLNVSDAIIRYLLVDMTEHYARAEKQSLNKATDHKTHLELNKGKVTTKQDLLKHLGIQAIDYKDTEFLKQFASPYHKLFHRKRTGNSAKSQRMVAQAIKRARHMALMAFTPKHDA